MKITHLPETEIGKVSFEKKSQKNIEQTEMNLLLVVYMHLKPLWGGLPMPGDSRSSSVTVGEFRNHPFATFHSQESFGIMSQYVVD